MSEATENNEVRHYLPTHDDCFVCGQEHPTGLRARYYLAADGNVRCEFKANSNQVSYAKIVHGGIIASLMDELMGWPICLETNLLAYTGEMTVRYKRQMFVDQVYHAIGFLEEKRPGKKYWEAKCAIADGKGRVLAEGKGRYFLIPAPQTKMVSSTMTYQPGDLRVFDESFEKPQAPAEA